MAGQQTITMVIAGDASRLVKSLKVAGKETTVFAKTTKFFALAAATAFATATAAASVFATQAIKASSDLAETSSKTEVIFGKSAASLKAFAKTTADSLGQTQTQFLDAASTFGIFGKAAKLSNTENVKFSTNLAKLASDLASFNNTSVDDAVTALGAALRGENEPIRRYGVLLDDAALKAQALADGTYNGKGTLDQSAKVLAAYKLILKQTTTQQGDFNRTQDGFANASRRVSALWGDLQTTVGDKLLPVLVDVLPDVVDELKKLSVDPEFNKALENAAEAIKGLAKALPQVVNLFNDLWDVVSKLQGVLSSWGIGTGAEVPSWSLDSWILDILNNGKKTPQQQLTQTSPGTTTINNYVTMNSLVPTAQNGQVIAQALEKYQKTTGTSVAPAPFYIRKR